MFYIKWSAKADGVAVCCTTIDPEDDDGKDEGDGNIDVVGEDGDVMLMKIH